ncbi:helix-turn-helix transcriptional regulator [Mycolicibacterium elephantis]|uniref:Uncharacterized protein n=1 Tax=Mycolicibacterium elephantis DSM 44368 TaxID=1335622 RepID=A0A439DV03_9MYCO|nr:hypothetical protein [Mycolicibacterium elephantis]MCV7220837.1 hypothetical protein [Mycolicibacterium elephantis]RWA20871.1 hypothetical protein MELE44368_02660 [Mycolicibacterium elephantis DSM 44368]
MTTDDWVITYAFDLDPTDEMMEQWTDDLESVDALVARRPGVGVNVTVYGDGHLPMLAAGEKMMSEVTSVINAELVGVSIARETLHAVLAESPTMPELMSAAEIAEELGVARQRVHQLRSMPSFPAPLAELRGGAVWDASAVRKFHATWARKPGRPSRVGT